MHENDMSQAFEQSTNHNTDSAPQSHIESFSSTLALATVTPPAQGVAPVVRNIARSIRTVTRVDISAVAVRSIDSTQAKSRAGLFNHKILFYTHPRHYYLNGLVRLII